MKRLVLPALALLYAGGIFYLSSRSQMPGDFQLFYGADKLAHLLEYLGLGVLVTWTLGTYGASPKQAVVYGAVVCSLYGLSDEFHQAYVPGRESSLFDWLADSVGGALGAASWFYFLRRESR